jgi:zona occludens toxin
MSSPLVIRTGLPGHGKTLNTIKEVDAQALEESRVVYYHNVAGLNPGKLKAQWFEFEDPLKWHELPKDCIIVVDEAQGSEEKPMFGTRDPRKAVPPHVAAFETIRHRGHQMHLITQDPRFLDVHIRRLCNEHIHFWRIFGSEKISRYVTPRVVNDVEKLTSFSQSSRTVITLDKAMFGTYTSSQGGHHFKFRLPRKAVMAICVIVVAVVGIFSMVSKYSGTAPGEQGDTDEGVVSQVADTARSVLPSIAGAAGGNGRGTPVTRAQYIDARAPRVEQLPASAPVYDGLTEAKAYPRLYCMSSSDESVYRRNYGRMPTAVVNGQETVCQCYTQQGTRLDTDFQFCAQVVERGYFDPAIADRGGKNQMLPERSNYQASIQPSDAEYVPHPITVVGSGKPGHLW